MGDPVANEPVYVGSPPGEEPTEYTTDENGEVVISFQNSSPDDAVEHEVVVRDETRYVHVTEGEQRETFSVASDDDGDDTDDETHTLEVVPLDGTDAGVTWANVTVDGETKRSNAAAGPDTNVAAFELEDGTHTP